MNPEILDKFSTHLKNTLVRAYALAQELRQPSIEPPHLLFALSAQKGSIASEVLTKLGLTSDDIKRSVSEATNAAASGTMWRWCGRGWIGRAFPIWPMTATSSP